MIAQAIRFAADAHYGQFRKYTYEPYLSHCTSVMGLVASIRIATDDMLCAAVLHDVVEDTNRTIEDITESFGVHISSMVQALTSTPKSFGDRHARKQRDIVILSQVSWNIQTIKVADIIDNVKTIQVFDPKFAKVYIPEKIELLDALKYADSRLKELAYTLMEK